MTCTLAKPGVAAPAPYSCARADPAAAQRGQVRSPPRPPPRPGHACRHPCSTATRERVIDALVALSERPDAAAVLGLGGTQADLVALNAASPHRPDRPRRRRLHRRPLRRPRLRDPLERGASAAPPSRVAITSSVFGLVRPGDRIPAYRLSGDVSLPGLGPVAGLWREALGAAVEEAVGSGLLVDLRSTMYAAFWRPPATSPIRVATVRVLHEHDGDAQGRQPLQQGHQGPDRPRPAGGRRQPAHAAGPREARSATSAGTSSSA